MKEPELLWFDLVNRFAKQSKCKSRAVGAIIVKDDCLIAEGFNSAPCGSTTEECPRQKCNGVDAPSGGALDQAICSHAEANALANCAKRGVRTEGAELYVSCLPCSECAKAVVGAGIKKVVYIDYYDSPLTFHIFEKAKVEFRQFLLPKATIEGKNGL